MAKPDHIWPRLNEAEREIASADIAWGEPLLGVLRAVHDRLDLLLKVIGRKASCKYCGQTIGWIMTRSGRSAPYNPDGISHFATCPKAQKARTPHASSQARRY